MTLPIATGGRGSTANISAAPGASGVPSGISTLKGIPRSVRLPFGSCAENGTSVDKPTIPNSAPCWSSDFTPM